MKSNWIRSQKMTRRPRSHHRPPTPRRHLPSDLDTCRKEDALDVETDLRDVRIHLGGGIEYLRAQHAESNKVNRIAKQKALEHERTSVSSVMSTNGELRNHGYTVRVDDTKPILTRFKYSKQAPPSETPQEIATLNTVDITTTPYQSSRF